jgi:acyl-CoA thioester hydrolase
MHKPPYDPDLFFYWTEIPVRFRDLDALNHVNNAVFNTYFEEARVRFIEEIPELKRSVRDGFSFVLVHLEIDYIKPVLLHETVIVGSSIANFGNSSIDGFQAIYSKDGKELKAVAKTTGVWFDLNKNRPARLPEIPNRDQYLFKADHHG